MRFSRNLQLLYDFYWRLYDTFIPASRSLETLEYETGKEGKIRAINTIWAAARKEPWPEEIRF